MTPKKPESNGRRPVYGKDSNFKGKGALFTRFDWVAIRAFAAAMPAGQRRMRDIADHFGVEERNVRRHWKREGWDDYFAKVDAERRRALEAEAFATGLKRDRDTIRLFEAAQVRFAQQLRDPDFKVSAGDIVALAKLVRLIMGEPTERPEERRRITLDDVRELPAPAAERLVRGLLAGKTVEEVELDDADVVEEEE